MATRYLTQYDAATCTIMVDGVHITGLGEDMVTGEKSEDYFTPSVGAQGDVIKNIINNTLGEVTIVVQATSPQKSHLMSLATKKEPFPIWVVNEELGERFGGELANLLSAPSVSRGSEAEDMEFVFQVFDYTVEQTEATYQYQFNVGE